MKQIKIFFCLVLAAAWLASLAYPAAENDSLELRLPLRVTEGVYRFKPLTADDITLIINGGPVPLSALVEQEKSIAWTPELGRTFVLSFHINEYNKKIEDAVSYLATEVLNNSDMLFILTPLNVFRVTVSSNKLRMINKIGSLVKKDCAIFNKKKIHAEKHLESMFDRVKLAFANPYVASPYIETSNFLKIYPPEFINYNNRYLLPDIGKYRKVIEFLGVREGERWCIHFQQREMYSLIFKTRQFFQTIKGALAPAISSITPLGSYFSMFERELARLDSYSARPLLEVMHNGQINYSAVTFGGISERPTAEGQLAAPYTEGILKNTARASGGVFIETMNPLEGIRRVIEHQDHYYELVFDIDRTIEEKKIQISLKGSSRSPEFKAKFSKAEMASLIDYLSRRKLTIDEFSLRGEKVSFKIRSFDLQDREGVKPFGILRVNIRLHDEWGERVYTSERILRTLEDESGTDYEILGKDIVRVSHHLPVKYQGKFMLVISVADLIRNSLASTTQNITLTPGT